MVWVIIGNIGDLLEFNFIYIGDEFIYSFMGSVQNVDSFYWDFGDFIILIDLNLIYFY